MQSPSDSTPSAEGRVAGNGRVVEVELGEIRGMKVSLTVRPHDEAADFGAIVRLAEELRVKLGATDHRQPTSPPQPERSDSEADSLFWTWAQPENRG